MCEEPGEGGMVKGRSTPTAICKISGTQHKVAGDKPWVEKRFQLAGLKLASRGRTACFITGALIVALEE